MNEGSNNQPLFKRRYESVQVAVWGRPYETRTGSMRTAYNVVVKRSYKDKDGNWQETESLDGSDVGNAIGLLIAAQQFILEQSTK